MTISKNSEILFLYDAKLANPNGDMDDENKPRMDYDTNTNLVSDVRLKRYLRDYFEQKKDEPIFVTEKAEDAKDRAKQLKKEDMEHTDLIDVRLFGAVYARSGGNDHVTGPVQFNWGYSLNPVELNESSTITSSFSSGEGVGHDYRVKYSLIAFNGTINANVAEDSNLEEDDIELFDEAMIKSIPFNKTRSKTGQNPRLYIRVELEDNDTILKDLREYISLDYSTDTEYKVRSVKDFTVDLSELADYLEDFVNSINEIKIWKDDNLQIKNQDGFINKLGENTFNWL